MSAEKELFEKYQSMQGKLKELSVMTDKLERSLHNLMNDLSLTPEELNEYLENPENFPPAIWDEIQKEKEKMAEMLKMQLNLLRDPKQIKKKYSARGRVKKDWLPVR